MIFHALTTFPDLVRQVFDFGILRRGVESGLIGHNIHDLRDFTSDRHRSTDDEPFGGGPGMVMKAQPIFDAVEAIRQESTRELPLIYPSPAGEPFTHQTACDLAASGDFMVLCGRYEGVDQRVIDNLVDREISLGDYVLSGGELPAMCMFDAVARQIPGVIGNDQSAGAESFATGILDWPHYTRPENFRGMGVPGVLLSGNHAKISSFREGQALLLTYKRRPDLLTEEQQERVKQFMAEGRQDN